METREKEDAFAGRIVEAVEKKVISNIPALLGMYMAQMQAFSLPVPMGAFTTAQGGMMYGQALANGTNNRNAVMNGAVSSIASNQASNQADTGAALQGKEATTESTTEPPDNDLIDFDAF